MKDIMNFLFFKQFKFVSLLLTRYNIQKRPKNLALSLQFYLILRYLLLNQTLLLKV